MLSSVAVSNTKENDIFDNEKPDPFGFASQDQNAQANIVVKPKKVEKVFSLGTKTKVGKRVWTAFLFVASNIAFDFAKLVE